MHPFAVTGYRNGANGIKAGDRIVYSVDERHGVAEEFLHDGDAFVTFDDGTHVTVKWHNLCPESEPRTSHNIWLEGGCEHERGQD